MKETYTSIFPVRQKISEGMSWQEINLLSWQEVNQLDWFRISKSIKYIIDLVAEFIQKVEYYSTFEIIEEYISKFEKKLSLLSEFIKKKVFTVRW